MLLPEIKEREYRFKLALRMGFPIFALVLILISSTLLTNYDDLNTLFYVESILLIIFSIYFIFYIIYKSFDIRITEPITKTFTREYLYSYLKKEIKKNNEYTLFLVSVENIGDINSRYGIKNGDKVLNRVALWVSEYLKNNDLHNFPIGCINGGNFIIGLNGPKNQYQTILELFSIKSEDFSVDNIEVKINTAVTDKSISNKLDFLIEDLFEIKEINKNQKKINENYNEIYPDKLEFYVVNAIKEKLFIIMSQDVFKDDVCVIKECFVRLKTPDSNIIHQKKYIKILDKLGLMVDFHLMILEENISRCYLDSKEKFAISISPSTLRNPIFLLKVKELINNNEDVKNKIIFLLSEVEYYSQIKKYNLILKSLRDMGVLIAIDRLGPIHTSFLYLKELDIDIVRFDSSYTKDILSDKYNSIVDGLSYIAHAKGVKTWVKMVESKEIKDKIQTMNVDYMQGKYLSPVKIEYEN